jgi:hypothetical protein
MMHIIDEFYAKHEAAISQVVQQVEQQHATLQTLPCVKMEQDLGPLQTFMNEKTPTALKTYVAGVFMRSWVATLRRNHVPETQEMNLLHGVGDMLSKLGSYSILQAQNGEAMLRDADMKIVQGFLRVSEATGTGIEVTKFEDGKEKLRTILERRPPEGDDTPPPPSRRF